MSRDSGQVSIHHNISLLFLGNLSITDDGQTDGHIVTRDYRSIKRSFQLTFLILRDRSSVDVFEVEESFLKGKFLVFNFVLRQTLEFFRPVHHSTFI